MSKFLITDENPEGYKLEEILTAVRNDIIHRATKIMDDGRPEAVAVLNNNILILGMLAQCIELAEDSSRILDKAFGPHQSDAPRIGAA